MSLLKQPIRVLHKQLKNREISAVDLAEDSLKRIGETDDQLGTFLYKDEEGVRERARQLDEPKG